MRAVVISSHQGPSAVDVREWPEPEAQPGRVLIDVRAAGVSFPELLQTKGMYQHSPELPFVPGIEVAGVVRQAAADSGFAPGDAVVAITGVGGLAEVASAKVTDTFRVPAGMDFVHAVAIPLNFFTAHFAIVVRARLEPGQTALVHGAAGGLGTACVALCRALGARVIAVVSNEAKAEVARRVGADDVVLTEPDWRASVAALAPEGVDVVLDPVGGDRAVDSLRVLRPLGRYVVLGFTEGRIPEIKVNRLLLRNLDVVGAGWGAYYDEYPEAFPAHAQAALDLIASGEITPEVGFRFPLHRAAEAFATVDERRALGKVVVEVA